MNDLIREPKQKRAIEKKEKIIEAGFKLICKNGYYNTNTAEIAKEAGVSTGIIYQYFKDKYDILILGIEKYSDDLFFPLLKNKNINFNKKNFNDFIRNMINNYISNHKISSIAHEEIMAGGSFTPGATIEFSGDGPLIEPYTCFMQGGLTYEYGKLGIMIAVTNMLKNK